VNVSLNGVALGTLEWDGKQAIHETFSIPAAVLRSDDNTLSLSLPGLTNVAIEGVWLDAFSLTYARSDAAEGQAIIFDGSEDISAYPFRLSATNGLRAYDVTDPDRPQRLSDFTLSGDTITLGDIFPAPRRYAVVAEGGILSSAKFRQTTSLPDISGADYLIITPAEFQPALNDLLALRTTQGLSGAMVDVQAIFDAFGEGIPDPIAIRAYLENAYTAWNPPPLYVLLVGDGTSDPKHYQTASSDTFIPPYLADVDPWAGETASDNRYVTVDGDDVLPDMLIGRLPVNSLAEAQTVADKIVEYEIAPAAGLWNNFASFIADDKDEGGDFPLLAESLTPFIFPPNTPQRIYYTPPNNTADAVRASVLGQWNSGAGLMTYSGHSSIHQWAVEQFLHLDDIPTLNNGGRLPVLLELTCFTSMFQEPFVPTLDESLLRHPNGGAVAVWGATGLGVATGHDALAKGFLQSLFPDGVADLGTATLAGKLNLSITAPDHLDLLDTFVLLGDPATQFYFPAGMTLTYLPLTLR
jgi:hypothetical protein